MFCQLTALSVPWSGHLLVEDLRAAVNAIAPRAMSPESPKEESERLRLAANSGPFIPSFVPTARAARASTARGRGQT
jgi:hypothetical protein